MVKTLSEDLVALAAEIESKFIEMHSEFEEKLREHAQEADAIDSLLADAESWLKDPGNDELEELREYAENALEKIREARKRLY